MVTYDYPRPAVAVDIVIFRKRDQELEVLLIKRGKSPYKGVHALPGGFVNMDEDLEETASRELQEETGVSGIRLRQIRAFGKPDRDPRGRVISIAYLGQLSANQSPDLQAGDDAARVAWFSIRHLPELAFDHAEIITSALALFEMDQD
jgi:8-oxo-dGTP diphosphatase